MFDFYVISSDYSPFVRSLDLKAVPQSSFFSGFSSLPEVALKGYVQEACQKGQTFGYRPRDFTPKAFFFDMDHTSICEESLVQLAYASGVGEAIEKLTQEGLRGEINFANSLKQRVALLRGVPQNKVLDLARQITFRPGLKEFSDYCQIQRLPLFLATGGFVETARCLVDSLKFQDFCANEFIYEDSKITGQLALPIVDTHYKRTWLIEKCNEWGLSSHKVVAIGDGANDRSMFRESGLAVGFQPQESVWGDLHMANFSGSHEVLIPFLQKT